MKETAKKRKRVEVNGNIEARRLSDQQFVLEPNDYLKIVENLIL